MQKKIHHKAKVGVVTGDNAVASSATAAMDAIKNQAVSSAAMLVGSEGGAEAIAAILGGITDSKILATTIQQVAPCH